MPNLFHLKLLDEVYEDIENASFWYDDKAGLGQDFLDIFNDSINILKSSPYIYQVCFADYRKFSLKRFPYVVFYKVAENKVVVVGVFHGAQDPDSMIEKINNRV